MKITLKFHLFIILWFIIFIRLYYLKLHLFAQDVVYHNEAFNESDSSGDLSPEVEEKKSGGFLAAIISAIKSATHRSTPGNYIILFVASLITN